MEKYKITVITAFCNTDFDLFERADKSMRNQTIGFKNVQWIIVMHNCDKEHIDKVINMYKEDENVIVKILNNDKHTAGSPRNEAFKYVEAKYIMFLDSDDSYSSDCIEKIVYEMDYTNADVLRYRMEEVAAEEGIQTYGILSSANSTYERIICKKGDWNLDAMFSGYYGCCATQVYNFDFIKKNDLLFDEEQPVGEDILFNTMALVKADIVCILPRYIGYQYYQNNKSTCRVMDNTDDEIIEIAKGYERMFKAMIDYGADITFFCYGLVALILCAKILKSKSVTKEGRIKVKEILGEYIINMPILPKNKYYDTKTIFELYSRAKTAILFPEKPIAQIIKNKINGIFTIMSIVRNNLNTDYAKRYHFDSFRNEKAYIHQVPLSDKKTYKPLIDLMYRVAEKNIIIEKDVDSYIKAEDSFIFPTTNSFIKDLTMEFSKDLTKHYNFYVGKCNDSGIKGADNAYVDSLESLLIKCYSSYKIYVINNQMIKEINGPSFLHRYFGDEEVYENLLSDALIDRNVDQIVSINAKNILDMFKMFESNYVKYIDNLKCGKERKEELIKICEGGFTGIAKKIWPKLERVIAFGCGKYKDAYNEIKKYFEGVHYNHASYFTEMGILGKAISDDSDIFEIYKDKYFIELIDSLGNTEETVLPTDSVVDKIYEMVITNENGLYRYKTSIFIKPIEVNNTTFRFKFI